MKTNYMAGAEPFFEQKSDRACLLVHGFSSSPFEMMPLAKYLSAENYTVAVPLLPGHGTVPEELTNVHWRDWHNMLVDQLEKLRQGHHWVSVIGLSLGGSLSLHLAAHHHVDAVIAMAPGLVLQNKFARYAPHLTGLSNFQLNKNGTDIKNHAKTVSYTKYPIHAVSELSKFFEHLKDDLADVTCPALLITAENDHVVHPESSEIVFSTISSKFKEHMKLKESYHIITLDLERFTAFEKIKFFLASL